MSLKNILFSAIKDVYPNMLSLDEINRICDSEKHKRSMGERRLRELCNGKYPLIKPIKGNKGYITGYQFIKIPVDPKFSISYDEQLKNILFVTSLAWHNADKIKEIEKAIKSSSEYYKRSIIEKYR